MEEEVEGQENGEEETDTVEEELKEVVVVMQRQTLFLRYQY